MSQSPKAHARPRCSSNAPSHDELRLPHWSSVEPRRPRPSLTVGAVLRDLVDWGADLASVLTRHQHEDMHAIDSVRAYARAWIAGAELPAIQIEDLLTSVATLLAAVDLRMQRDDDEREEALDEREENVLAREELLDAREDALRAREIAVGEKEDA
ncbi:MAG TPA: hypothetical protein VGM88_11695 [Kofleriaceae bacterium]